MKTHVFVAGFALSMAMIGVCVMYAALSPAGGSIVLSFDPALRGWYVHAPVGYNLALLVFAILNLPVILIDCLVIAAVDMLWPLPAVIRMIVAFATAAVLSALWWGALARWSRLRSIRVRP